MPLTQAELGIISLFVEAVTYGIFLTTFVLCFRTLVWTRSGDRMKSWEDINKIMFSICVLLPVFATINLALNLIRAIETAGPRVSQQFSDLGAPQEVLKFFTVDIITLLVDFMMIYRVWILYGRSWAAAAVPILLWFGVLVTLALNIHFLRSTHTSLTAVNYLRPIITSFWSISIALNILTTSMIVAKIYSVDSSLSSASVSRLSDSRSRTGGRALRNTIRVIVESGALYTSVAIASCITYSIGHPSVYIITAIEIQTAGIAFNLIIIRVAASRPTGDTTLEKSRTTIPLAFLRGAPTDIEVSVAQTTHHDGDSRFKQSTTMAQDASEFDYKMKP